MIKQKWQALSERTATLQMREKWLVFSGVMVLMCYLTLFYVIMPLMDEIERANTAILAQIKKTETTQQQIGLYQGALGKDPNKAVNESIEKTEASIVEVDKLLAQLTVNFISPHKMREVLTELLKSDSRIKVTEFTALPAEKVNIDGVPANADITIYQHGIRLTVQGSYFDLQQYIKRIEDLPWQFNWKDFAYQVQDHPNAKLEIEITTISTNEQFIAI